MAEQKEQDTSQKTEEPTEHRLKKATEKGQIPLSRDLNSWSVLAGFWLVLGVLPFLLLPLFHTFAFFIGPVADQGLDTGQILRVLIPPGKSFLLVLLVCLLVPFGCAVGSGLLQTRGILNLERLVPRLDHISPAQGLKKILGLQAWAEFLKTTLKFACVALTCALVMKHVLGEQTRLVQMPDLLPVREGITIAGRHLHLLLLAVVVLTGVIAVLDVFWQRFSWRKNLKMTIQELRDEYKETEGDPVIQSRFRALRQERARKRMMAAVPKATVVVMNPTHYAVALAYNDAMEAPQVVAKGVDGVAMAIRQAAQKHGVPVAYDAPLARLLHKEVALDGFIPERHYQAVARVIRWVMSLNKDTVV